MSNTTSYELLEPSGLDLGPARDAILTPDALGFVADLAAQFTPRVKERLAARQERQARLDRGEPLDFLDETRAVRDGDWTVSPLPADLKDRRVEITGPTDRKMVINALNSGANCYMADFEDSNTPTWSNLVHGQNNLRDAAARSIEYTDPSSGKHYALKDKLAVLLVRPRGWHLWEKHMRVGGEPVPGGLVDFGLYFYHNARALLDAGSGPYFYLPKMESHLEARLWNDVFNHAQAALDIPRGSIKATVLIETIPASFEMHEILYELREHSAGLNCGRWDYIFSFIKRFRNRADYVLPDRQQVTMTQPFMRAYTQLVIQTCHRREVHAMGGMAAQIPIKNDEQANLQALEKVRADKLREVQDGHDGTWVAHPALVSVAREVFDAHMPSANQIERKREDVEVSAAELVEVPTGERTDDGLRYNMRVGIQYLEAWLGGSGAVPIYHLMEDAATAEISRAQIWQWLHHEAAVGDAPLDAERLRVTLDEEMQVVRDEVGAERFDSGHFQQARDVFEHLCLDREFAEFLTLPAYERLLESEGIA
ncbi:MAG TPA: malate synthase A [Gammaproteobacteria bacterium]|nr:malate synthase A [Gammaproteobacteria bacterium]